MMIRILIADRLHPCVKDALADLDVQIDEQPDLSAEALVEAIAGKDVLIVRSTRVTSDAIAAADRLSLIVRAGAGINTIDVAAASANGIYVANCPGVNAAAVAELAVGLLIAADRQIVGAATDLRAGQWKKKAYGDAHGLKGRTLGILGLGAIGRAVARVAVGMEMNVLAWSRKLTAERAAACGACLATSPLELAQQSDAVTVHLALGDETRHLINADFLGAMRDGAILVNTSRGDLVDTAALKAAIQAKHLRVGLDVYENEPAGGAAEFADVELARLVTGTPHIGASTAQTSEAIGDTVGKLVRQFVLTGAVTAAVNMCSRSPATHRLIVRHLDRVGVLAGVLDCLREENINVEEMNNAIFEGARAAVCTLQLDSPPTEQTLERLRADESILQLTLYGQEG